MTRNRFLKAGLVVTLASLSGCSGSDGDGAGDRVAQGGSSAAEKSSNVGGAQERFNSNAVGGRSSSIGSGGNAGSRQSVGGSAIGSSIVGGAFAVGGSGQGGEQTSSGGSSSEGGASAVGGSGQGGAQTSSGGSSNEGGASAVGGSGQGGAQTSSGGSRSFGGSSAAGGSGQGGAQTSSGGSRSEGGSVAVGGSGQGGAQTSVGGSSNTNQCDPLCGRTGCGSQQPECLPKAFRFDVGYTALGCVPPSTVAGLTVCTVNTCAGNTGAGNAGCGLSVRFTDPTWTLLPGVSGNTNVNLTGRVTAVTGQIIIDYSASVKCTLSVVLPAAGIPYQAAGVVAAPLAADTARRVSFSTVAVDTATATMHVDAYTGGLNGMAQCSLLANLGPAFFESQLNAELLSMLNRRASAMQCLACRQGDCQEGIACVD